MPTLFLQLLIFGLLPAAANVLGGYILFPSKLHDEYRRFLRYLLAIGAGFMLAVTLVEIFPNAVTLWLRSHPATEAGLYVPALLLVAGYMLTQFLEHTIAPHFHLG